MTLAFLSLPQIKEGPVRGRTPDYNDRRTRRPGPARPCLAWAPPPCHYPGLERTTHAEDRQAIVYNSRRVCFIVVIALNANARRVGPRQRIRARDTPEIAPSWGPTNESFYPMCQETGKTKSLTSVQSL
ncbi:hypothetical protein GEV33_006525 [Tenebrio molitor]|uniref:Uncharacterized protein n=1 Tax=Tenebrio molitor TaxID=7067 RepID=A0A8J6HLM6_TENMO|nr:hypothetical protein GEV33_006525 [Tenebrio molitor]